LSPLQTKAQSVTATEVGADEKSPNHPKNGGVKGKRPSKKDKLRALAAKGHGQG